eukprot:Amastigsp_a175827_49.p1 type:complete len:118 gc:universal Amastigsp_a175827_49:32-385(+)
MESLPTVYEVNTTVDNDVRAEYLDWLQQRHIGMLLAIEGFETATVHEVESDGSTADRTTFSIVYHLTSRAALQSYIDIHAPVLRAESIEKFGAKLSAQRRILKVLSTHVKSMPSSQA